MPTHKPDLSRLSITQLADITGMSARTIVKRLEGLKPAAEDGKTVYYNPREAIPKLYGYENPLAEKIRFDAARADAQEMRNAETRGELVRGDDVDGFLLRLVGAFVQRIRAVAPKAAPEVRATASDAEAEALLARFHDEALTEIADAGRRVADRVARADTRAVAEELRRARGGAPASAASDSERVVGRGEDAVSGVERGAGAVEDGEG